MKKGEYWGPLFMAADGIGLRKFAIYPFAFIRVFSWKIR